MRKRHLPAALLCVCLIAAGQAPYTISPQVQTALGRISEDSLRGNLSFLASDLLEGRDTPSKGLDIAAEFIAAQFRKAGLEPGGNDGYFQTSEMVVQQPNLDGFSMTLGDGARTVAVSAAQVDLHANQALELAATPVFKLDLTDSGFVEALTPEQLEGKVVLAEMARGAQRNGRKAMGKVRSAHPALIVMIERNTPDGPVRGAAQLLDPEDRERSRTARITVSGKEAAAFYDSLKPGLTQQATVELHAAAPLEKTVVLRNVVAILRGSDPLLKNTCVLLTAHYDHIGMQPDGAGDRIFNGANDDGSGTVSVIEVGTALARLRPRPKRSIVFVTFFGEEKGGFGSRYYSRHPAIPMKDTVADINLEQVGRTDSTEGPQLSNASMTGYDYSDVTSIMQKAGRLTGVKLYKHAQNSDIYFGASDNVFLAEKGVPAHSFSVAFNYPDYHGLGDEWQKINYANMAKVDRTVALGLVMIADSPQIPHWNAANPKVEKYLKAWQDSHASK